jgi:hypothetical protein
MLLRVALVKNWRLGGAGGLPQQGVKLWRGMDNISSNEQKKQRGEK